jgi:hypothetical protein
MAAMAGAEYPVDASTVISGYDIGEGTVGSIAWSSRVTCWS